MNHKNIRRRYKESSLVLLLVVSIILNSCKKATVTPDENSQSDFEKQWNTTDMYYPFFEFKDIDWDDIYMIYQHEFDNYTQRRKIELLGNLLNELKDGHANLIDAHGKYISFYRTPRSLKDQDSFSREVIAGYF